MTTKAQQALMDKIAARHKSAVEEQATRGKKVRLQKGRNVFRILPPAGDMDFPWKEAGMHYSLGPEGKQSEFCPQLSKGADCPVCELYYSILDTGSAEEKKDAKDYRPVRRYYFNVILREKENAGVRVLEAPETVWTDILALYSDEVDPLNVHDEKAGFDIVVHRTGEMLNTEYAVKSVRKASPISADTKQQKKWLEACDDLNEYVLVSTYKELEAILYGPEEGGDAAQLDAGEPEQIETSEEEVVEETTVDPETGEVEEEDGTEVEDLEDVVGGEEPVKTAREKVADEVSSKTTRRRPVRRKA